MRVLERLERLYAIGGGPGANRPAYSAAEQEAHDLVAGWMREAGLDTAVDPYGNLLGRLAGRRPDAAEVWTGSHLDSVPAGGRFDGALGVVAGLEAVERAGQGERTLGVVAFRDEEGWRFGRGCFGSRALCGLAGEDDRRARDDGGVSLGDAIAALGLGAGPQLRLPETYVELHVEQGPRLEAAGAPLAVVTGIVGSVRAEKVFAGRADHAGTTPMDVRSDALCAAAEYVLGVRRAAAEVGDAVATVGQLVVSPGASNVVPARVTLTVDARAPDRERLDALVRLLDLDGLRVEPVAMAAEPTGVLREELAARGLPVLALASGAGHDAGVLAARGVETAMLFVRGLAGGVSHSAAEESSAEDVELAVDVLASALRRLAGSGAPASGAG